MGNGVHDELIRKKDALDALMAERKHLLAKGQKGAEHILTHHGYNVIEELDVPVINVGDMISRQAAIDIERNATVDTNPSHFEAHQKFTQFMDDAEISSFGRWQWSNGFNTALTAVGIDLKKLPSAQPTLMRSIGKLVGYTGNKCPNCGRLRVERYESGLEICEKCNWCEQTKSYWLDWEEG